MTYRVEMPNTFSEPAMREDSLPEKKQWWHQHPEEALDKIELFLDQIREPMTSGDIINDGQEVSAILRILGDIDLEINQGESSLEKIRKIAYHFRTLRHELGVYTHKNKEVPPATSDFLKKLELDIAELMVGKLAPGPDASEEEKQGLQFLGYRD